MTTTIILDADYIKFAVAAVCEKRTILVTHKQSGRQKEFNNRTEFWGRGAKKDGGWLAETNIGKTSPWFPNDFDIEDRQTITEPLENCLHSAKLMVEGVCKTFDTKKYKLFLGKGDSFRVGLSTIIKYKGNRDDSLRPLLLPDVEEYLVKKFKAEIVTHLEADDRCVMECYKKDDHILVGVDKDYAGSPVLWHNPNHPEWGVQDGNSIGELWLDDKKKVRGRGRLFMYFQIASSDKIDNYAANSASDIKWGEMSAYKELVDCNSDKKAFQKMSKIYRNLYPEPKVITGWRGDEFEIDWKYVLNENFNMAKMIRFEGDSVNCYDLLNTFDCLRKEDMK